jgi:hypothetical protein
LLLQAAGRSSTVSRPARSPAHFACGYVDLPWTFATWSHRGQPSVRKRQLHLPGKDKEAARQRALQLFPSQHALLARKKDHGRAEAALIVVASLERAP